MNDGIGNANTQPPQKSRPHDHYSILRTLYSDRHDLIEVLISMDKLREVTERMPEVLSLPPKWLHMYEDFVAKNASSVSQIESALRSLTYIIPGTSPVG